MLALLCVELGKVKSMENHRRQQKRAAEKRQQPDVYHLTRNRRSFYQLPGMKAVLISAVGWGT